MKSVHFSQNPAQDLQHLISQMGYSGIGVITDTNTVKYCYPLIQEALPESHALMTFQAGEAHKNLQTCTQIWQWMTDQGFDRKALVINVGGGVVGDMGGFCAATYKRGIRFINVPTTLLSQVDASVGGKLGIDFQGFKNHIGVFTEPETVLVADLFLQTLPKEELRSGYAEVLKHGLIANVNYFRSLRKSNWEEQDWRTIIEKSIAIKRDVVDKDPKESGLRKILNFGHTIGHALESFYLDGPKHLLHGEAIAAGMIAEAFLSHQKAGLALSDMNEIIPSLLEVYGKISIDSDDVDQIVALCKQDKKNVGSSVRFSLLRKIGQCDYDIAVSEEEIKSAIASYSSSLV
ncbi:3-dehydroquinate synthase [Mongoliitalea daihaiensis]|uniref:3-dehydroquinate synthase n=1 Tax=Mongoliitalea daihaiensis TaxID=2782006 RepID=UPI001F180C0E|nr:3-dehydroquinate synthase [Mongoliitalea daihaiensis]UJP64676.1 3-dehydroquinate synthase [Mongoliitalea daihaiensis]